MSNTKQKKRLQQRLPKKKKIKITADNNSNIQQEFRKMHKAIQGDKTKKLIKAIRALVRLVKVPYVRIERPSPGIMHRQSIHQPLHTGTKVIDALIPIGTWTTWN